ncbi:MAG: phosphodiester glycosidase family protein [Myxococcota bacterium]
MNARRTWVVVLSSVCIVAAVALYWSRPSWRGDAFGAATRIESLQADLIFLDATDIVERGPGRVLVLRFDGPIELVPFHYEGRFESPVTIDAWGDEVDFPVLFNAGQYDEASQHLGWLKANGQWLSEAYRAQWKALLVSAPRVGPAWSGIIDLERSDPDVVDGYGSVVQSMMLVDAENGVRVRDTDRTACRTVVAQDYQGRLLVVLTEGAVTLADLGRWLTEQAQLGIVRAMNLDGGLESQLALRTEGAALTVYGQYGTGTFDATAGPLRRRLPAVIGIRPVAGE